MARMDKVAIKFVNEKLKELTPLLKQSNITWGGNLRTRSKQYIHFELEAFVKDLMTYRDKWGVNFPEHIKDQLKEIGVTI